MTQPFRIFCRSAFLIFFFIFLLGGCTMTEHRRVHTEKAPRPAAAYSQAVMYGNLVFVSGQGAVDPATQKLVRGEVEEEAERTLNNIRIILEEAGSSLDKVLKVNVYTSNMDYYERFNKVYEKFFTKDPRPARTFVQAARLPYDIKIEIECVAYR